MEKLTNKKSKKLTVDNINFEQVKEEVCRSLVAIFGKSKMEKENKDIVFFSAYEFLGIDAFYRDVKIVVRKVTNTKTLVIAQYENSLNMENWRTDGLTRAFSKAVEIIDHIDRVNKGDIQLGGL